MTAPAVPAFERAFAVVVGEEGGFTADPRDPGNWTGGRCGVGACRGTKYGIAANAHPTLDIASLTLDAARAIYRREYWDRVRGDELPPPLALLVFDGAVNSGVGRSAKWLQAALGVEQDGAIGRGTLAAVAAAGAKPGGGARLCVELLARRLMFDAALATWKTFGLGWARRLFALPFHAAAMGQGSG